MPVIASSLSTSRTFSGFKLNSNTNATQNNSTDTPGKSGDQVIISNEALLKQREAAAEKMESNSGWASLLDIENGTTMLSNGNKQVVTMDDSHIEILEYSGNKVVRKVEGDLRGDIAVLDTERYDMSGNIEQSMHTELNGVSEAGALNSNATMSRSIMWYDQGSLSRSMNDSMALQSSYSILKYADDALLTDVDAESEISINFSTVRETDEKDSLSQITDSLTEDTHKTQYAVHIKDFQNGHLVQDMDIHMKGTYEKETSRSEGETIGMEDNSAEEQSYDTELRVHVTNYDSSGNMVREVQFSDKQEDRNGDGEGETIQSMHASWYNEGELVRESWGDLTLDESQNTHLGGRSSIIDILGLDADEYGESTPKSAGQMFSTNLLDAAGEADYFSNVLEGASSAYNPAQSIQNIDSQGSPYSISWTNEIYQNGEMVARQEDTESAKDSHISQELHMRIGGSLTENESPELLHSSSHTEESYEGGMVQEKASIKSRESVEQAYDEPDKVVTHITANEGNDLKSHTLRKKVIGKLSGIDGDFHDVAQNYAAEVGLTLDDVEDMIKTLGNQDSDKA